MGDFGLYAALSGTDNWAQKRQDKASNLMMLGQMEERSQKELNAQMQAEQGIQEQLDLMSTFDVLPEDQKAIEEVENRARMNIIKGITKFNGDLKKYVSSGGLSDLGEYRRSILTSSEMKNAVSNKSQYAQYIDAKQKDMFVGKAQIEVPVFDSKGNPKMKDGEIVREVKSLTMEEQMALRKRGLLDKIQVGMIEQKARINPDYFKKNFKDATKPWSSDNIVTEQNIRNTLKSQGFSDEQVNKLANEYGEGLTPETALKWKAMNAYELEKMKAEINYRNSKSSGSSSKGSGKTQITNTLNTTFTKLKQNPGEMMPSSGRNASPTALGASKRMTNKDTKYFKEWLSNSNVQAYDAHYANRKEDDKEENNGKYDLRGADVSMIEKVALTNPDNGNVESFIKAMVFYADDIAPDDIDDYTYNTGNWTETSINRKFINKDKETEYEEIDGWRGYVYIPVEKEVYDKGFASELAKYKNLGTNIQAVERGNTDMGDLEYRNNNFDLMVDEVMQDPRYTLEQAEQIVNYKIAQQGY